MANNYTTSAPSTLEFSGDNVGAGTIPLQYSIVITPTSPYVIQAADFFIGDALGVTGQLPGGHRWKNPSPTAAKTFVYRGG